MSYDGSIKLDTKLDTSGVEKGMSSIGTMAAAGVAAATAALGALGLAAIKMGSDFYAGMSEVKAISGASADDMAKLTDKAKEMGAKTKFSATESAEALKYMAMAGWNANAMLGGLPGVMNLAAASGESLGMVSDIVTDAMTAFGLQANQAGHFADVLAMASARSNTNVGLLGESSKYVAPVAGALGYNVEDTAVALGLMANAGIKGSQSGTALRSTLTNLAKPSSQVAKAMRDLDLSLTDSSGNILPLNELMVELREKFDALTPAQKAQYAAAIAGKEGMSGLLAIVTASTADFDKLTAAINDANGTAEEMARIMNDNLKGDIVILNSALEGLAIQFYESIDMPLCDIAQTATESVNQISEAFTEGGMEGAIDALGNVLSQWITKIVQMAPEFIKVGADLLKALIQGIREHIPEIMSAAVQLGSELIRGVASLVPELVKLGIELAKALVVGILQAIPEALSAFGSLIDGLDAVSIAILAVVAGFAAFQVAQGIATTIQAINMAFAAGAAVMDMYAAGATIATVATSGLGVSSTVLGTIMALFTGQITLATVATAAWNAVLALSPIGWVAIAVGAAVGVIALLANTVFKASEEEKKLAEANKEVISSSGELVEASKKSASTYASSSKALDKQAANTRNLMSQLDELSAKENKSAEDRVRILGIVDQLNSAIPNLNLAYDAEIDRLNMSSEAIQRNVEANEANLRLNALRERQAELAREQIENELQLELVQQQRADTEAMIADKTSTKTLELISQKKDLEAQEQALVESSAQLTAESDLLNVKIGEQILVVDQTQEALETYTEGIDGVKEAQAAWAESLGITADELNGRMDDIAKTMDERGKEIEKIYDDVAGSASDAFAKIGDGAKTISFDEMIKNLEHNAKAVDNWATNLQTLTDLKIDQGFLETFRNLGPESGPQLQVLIDEITKANGGIDISLGEINDTAQSKIDELNEKFGTGVTTGVEAMKTVYADTDLGPAIEQMYGSTDEAIKKHIKKYPEFGKALPDGLVDGVEEGASGYVDASKELFKKGNEAFTGEAGIESPSKVFDEHGQNIAKGLEEGVKAGTPNVKTAATDMAKAAEDGTKTAIQSANFPSLGRSICEGLADGITNNSSLVANTARRAVESAVSAAKQAGQINSPAKVMIPIGSALPEGMAVGIDRGAGEVESSMASLLKATAADAMRSAHIAASGFQARAAATASTTTINHSVSESKGGDVIIEKVVIEGAPINAALDADRVGRIAGRALGKEAAKQSRWNGVFVVR